MAKSKSKAAKPKQRRRFRLRLTAHTSYQIQMSLVAATAIVAALLAATLLKIIWQPLDPPPAEPMTTAQEVQDQQQIRSLGVQVNAIQANQEQTGITLVNTNLLKQELISAQVDLGNHNATLTNVLLRGLQRQLADTASKQAASSAAANPSPNPVSLNVPIVLYHDPPSDLDHQLDLLQQRGYTTITLDQLAAALVSKGSLPAKPVIITFDDGLESQLAATSLLTERRMRATFFIIDGGAGSNYCIGANRHPSACGDAYLTWSQVRWLDRNPLFTIASHTVNHLDLAQQPTAVQSFEIVAGKQQLEQELGHPVDDFAYPYGSFGATTVDLVHRAGFIAAVSTDAGTTQTTNSLLTLERIRATYDLP